MPDKPQNASQSSSAPAIHGKAEQKALAQARVAAALRDNLKRRKALVRARADGKPPAPDKDGEAAD